MQRPVAVGTLEEGWCRLAAGWVDPAVADSQTEMSRRGRGKLGGKKKKKKKKAVDTPLSHSLSVSVGSW